MHKNMNFSLVIFSTFFILISAAITKYENYKVIQAIPFTEKHLQKLKRWSLLDDRLDFWTEPTVIGKSVDILIEKSLFRMFSYKLKKANIHFKIIINNLQNAIDNEKEFINKNTEKVDLNKYNRYNTIQQFLSDTASSCNNCELFNIGKTSRNRDMHVIKIGAGQNKPGLFFECGIHAREWVAPAVCINIINKLANDYDTDNRVKEMLDRYDWFIIPVSNPDGYEYTFTNTRLWRKTRGTNPGSFCIGTDPNRNWGYRWGESGSSTNPCSDIFQGSSAFSAVETANIRDFVYARRDRMRAYMAVHSYGQYFLIPWSYATEYPVDFDDLEEAANVGNAALRPVHGSVYTVGHSAVLLGATSGSSDDWAKGGAGIKFAYTLELRDTGNYGFILPATQIKPNFEEVWEALYAMHVHYFNNWPMK